MLLGPDDKDKNMEEPEEKLFSSMSSAMNDNNDNDDQASSDDDLVESSFMVSFKANDPVNSVSEKLKEVEETVTPEESNKPELKDEFDDFELDYSINAFKPLNSVEDDNNFSKSEQPVIDEDPDLYAFAGEDISSDPFKAGNDLDFATSSGTTSAFSGKNVQEYQDDLELDEEALKISPFAPKGNIKPEPEKSEVKPQPDDLIQEETTKDVPSGDKTAPADDDTDEHTNIQTYGKVSSGVNAFAKNPDNSSQEDPKKDNKTDKSEPLTAPSSPAVEEKTETSTESKAQEHAAAVITSAAAKPVSENKTSPDQSAAVKSPESSAQSPFVPKGGQPAPASNRGPSQNRVPAQGAPNRNAPVKRQRPGSSDMEPTKPAFEQKGRPIPPSQARPSSNTRPAANSRPASGRPAQQRPQQHPAQQSIQPVNQVSSSKKKKKTEKVKKEPGKGGIIVLIALMAVALLGFWILEKIGNNNNTDTKKTKPSATTVATTEATTVEAASDTESSSEETTEPSVEETTEATTESTTETTEATTETTEETSEATTEATTEDTTTEAATEAATTTRSSTAEAPNFSYSITNPLTLSDGFKFDIAMTNNGSSDVSLANALNNLTISIDTADEITSLASDYFTFTADPNNAGTFIGTPKSVTLPAGETTNVTITGVTGDRAIHFQITNYYFDWNT